MWLLEWKREPPTQRKVEFPWHLNTWCLIDLPSSLCNLLWFDNQVLYSSTYSFKHRAKVAAARMILNDHVCHLSIGSLWFKMRPQESAVPKLLNLFLWSTAIIKSWWAGNNSQINIINTSCREDPAASYMPCTPLNAGIDGLLIGLKCSSQT